ncbi:hypothetical protein L9F63_023731, partial [Diploptera punctata]
IFQDIGYNNFKESSVGQSSGGDGVEGEEQEESSSSHVGQVNVEEALTTFRQQWQRELESPRHEVPSNSTEMTTEDAEAGSVNVEKEAKNLFLKGVENEQNGKLYEAIQFYRRAVQLVPDIEFRLYDASKLKPREKQEVEAEEDDLEAIVDPEVDSELEEEEDDDDDDTDLLSRLQRIFSRSMCVCLPQHEQKTTHISALPMEIILYILRWVVSSDLDLRSLEMCSRVCRGFYLCSRDPEIWRLACARIRNLVQLALSSAESPFSQTIKSKNEKRVPRRARLSCLQLMEVAVLYLFFCCMSLLLLFLSQTGFIYVALCCTTWMSMSAPSFSS